MKMNVPNTLTIVRVLLIPFFVAGAKLLIVMVTLHRYEKTGKITNENQLEIGRAHV